MIIYSYDGKLKFLQPLLQSSVLHDHSEMFTLYTLDIKKNTLINFDYQYFDIFFLYIINIFTGTFDQFKASLLNQSFSKKQNKTWYT